MATTNYKFTTITGTQTIDLVTDINTPLQQIDTAIKQVADSIPSTSDITTRITALENKLANVTGVLTKGTTYAEIANNGFMYDKTSTK